MSLKKLVVIFSSILFLALASTALEGKNGPCGGQTIATPVASHILLPLPQASRSWACPGRPQRPSR